MAEASPGNDPSCGTCSASIELLIDGHPPKFCHNCGSALTLTAQDFSLILEATLCPGCGAAIKQSVGGKIVIFCPTCGYRMVNEHQTENQTDSMEDNVESVAPSNTSPDQYVSQKASEVKVIPTSNQVDDSEPLNQLSKIDGPVSTKRQSNAYYLVKQATLSLSTSTEQSVGHSASEVKVMDACEPLNPQSKIDKSEPVLTQPERDPYDANLVHKPEVKASQLTNSKALCALKPSQSSSRVKSVSSAETVQSTKAVVMTEQATCGSKSSIRTHYRSLNQESTIDVGGPVLTKIQHEAYNATIESVVKASQMTSLKYLSWLTTQPSSGVKSVNVARVPPEQAANLGKSSNRTHYMSKTSTFTGNIRNAQVIPVPPKLPKVNCRGIVVQRIVRSQPGMPPKLPIVNVGGSAQQIVRSQPGVRSLTQPTVIVSGVVHQTSLQASIPSLHTGNNRKMDTSEQLIQASEASTIQRNNYSSSITTRCDLEVKTPPRSDQLSLRGSTSKVNVICDNKYPLSNKTHPVSTQLSPHILTRAPQYPSHLITIDKLGDVQKSLIRAEHKPYSPHRNIHRIGRQETNNALDENYNGCSLPIPTQIAPNDADKLSAPDKSTPGEERIKTSTAPTDVKLEVLDTVREVEALTADQRICAVRAVKRKSYDDIADIPYKPIHMDDATSVLDQKQSEAQQNLLLPSDEHGSVQRDDASPKCTVFDDDMDVSDSQIKQEMIKEEVTVRQISEYCVVCNFHPGSDQLLAQHYTDKHTAPILQVFNVSHFYKSRRKPIRSSPTPLESQTFYPTYKDLLPSTDPSALHLKAQELTDSVIHCGVQECGMGFVSYVDWKIHQQDKHQDSDALCKCQDCGVPMSYDELISHLDGENNCEKVVKANHFGVHLQKCDLESFTVCFRCGAMGTCTCDTLKCDRCGKLCKGERGLHCHQPRCNQKSFEQSQCSERLDLPQFLYQCPLCEYRHRLSWHLATHMKTHLDEAVMTAPSSYHRYKCTICDFRHRRKRDLYEHANKVHFRPNMIDYCQICDHRMDSFTAGWNHILSHQNDGRPDVPASQKSYQCRFCGRSMRNLTALKYHAAKHKIQVSYKSSDPDRTVENCNKCGFEYRSYCQGIYHTTTAHRPVINCILCEASFGYALDLLCHLQEDHSTSIHGSAKVPCRLCNKEMEIRNASEVVSHALTQHGDSLDEGRIARVNTSHCGLCKSVMPTVQDYMTHGCISASLIKCVICFKELDTKEELSDHIATAHIEGSGKRLIACKACDRVFETRTQLMQHKRDVHGGEANCHICFAPFKTVNKCIEHAETHFPNSAESESTCPAKTQKCLFCFRVMESREQSREHIRAHYEPSLTTYSKTCYNCSETLINAADAMRHSRMHFEEKVEGGGRVSHNCAVCMLDYHDEVKELEVHTNTHFWKNKELTNSRTRKMHVKCLECQYEATTTRNLCSHYKTSHNETSQENTADNSFQRKKRVGQQVYSYPCPFCDYSHANSFILLERHLLLHFGDAEPSNAYRPLTCTLCMENFPNSARLHEHVVSSCCHSGKMICQQCDIELPVAKSVWKHVWKHQHSYSTLTFLPDDVPSLYCAFCDVEIRSLKDALGHSKLHKLNRDERKRTYPVLSFTGVIENFDMYMYKCDKCELKVESFCKLQIHQTSEHSPSITCVLCRNSFTFVQELELHLKKVHSFEGGVQCTLCGSRLAGIDECVEHTKTEHSDNVSTSRFSVIDGIVCGICSTNLHTISDFLSHGTISCHSFKCVLCFEEFTTRDGLRDHLKTHNPRDRCRRARIFPCNSCGKVLRTNRILQTHMMCVHGERANCHLCFAAFDCVEECCMHIGEHYDSSKVVVKEYSCKFCRRVLLSKESSIEHAKAHYEPALNVVQCRVCSVEVSNNIETIDHSILHQTEDLRFECIICKQTEQTKARLHNHMKFHFSPGIVTKKCLECDTVFTDSRGLYNHYKREHWSSMKKAKDKNVKVNRQKKNECEICDFKCNRKAVLNDHILQCHLGDGPFTCSHCNEVLQTKDLLVAHLKEVEKLPSPCQICGKLVSNLAGHMKFNHSDRACGHCEYVTNISDRHLEDHIRANHIDQLTCEVCDMVYDTEVQLEAHLAVYSTMPIYTCELCEFRTHYRQVVVEEHMHAIHGIAMPTETQLTSAEWLPYHCSLCPEKFRTSDLVNTHINSLHKNEHGSWECHTCKMKFRWKAFLLNHQIAVHDKARCFTCETCGARFHCPDRLNRHIRFVHGGKRIYNCELCEKAFKRKDHLTQHIRVVHEGNKYWYRCQQCGVKFPQKSDVRKHTEAEHMPIELTVEAHTETRGRRQKKSHQCDQCDEVFALRSSLAEHVTDVHWKESDEDSDGESGSDVDIDSDVESGSDANDESNSEWEVDANDDSDDSDYIL